MIRGLFFTIDNELVFIENPEDLVQLIQQKIGYEAASMIRGVIEEIRSLEEIPKTLLRYSMKDRLNMSEREELGSMAESLQRLIELT